jgi:two-component system, NtrC family, response regulator AtoC
VGAPTARYVSWHNLGANAYLAKPFDLREVSLQLQRALETTRLQREVRCLRGQRHGYERLVGDAPAMRRVFETLERLEKVDAPTVLQQGESGTGKDLVAQAIHARGPRRGMPYLEVDCASLPEHLIESEPGRLGPRKQAHPGRPKASWPLSAPGRIAS